MFTPFRRDTVPQEFVNFSILVPVTPARIAISSVSQSLATSLFDAMIISVPVAAAHDIYWGGPNVIGGLTSNGLQIRRGIPVQLSIKQPRQLYELQIPLVDLACKGDPISIPNVVFEVNNIFLTADVAAVTAAVILFKIPEPFR
jgi:hypothetical protein